MNLKTILVIIGLIMLFVAVVLALGYFEVPPFNIAYEYMANFAGGFDTSQLTENPTTLISTGVGIAGTAATIGIPLYNKAKSAKEQAQQIFNDAQTKISSVTGELETKAADLKTAEVNLTNAQTKITNLETTAKEATTQANFYKAEFDKLQNSYTELQKLKAADVIGKLPGGTVITNPDGSQTAVIEKVVIK